MNSMFTSAINSVTGYNYKGAMNSAKGYDYEGYFSGVSQAAKGAYSDARKPARANLGNPTDSKFSAGMQGLNAGRKAAGVSAVMGGSMAGAGYGAMSDDTSMIGGAFMGAGMGYGAKKFKTSMFS